MHIRHTARATATQEEAQQNPSYDGSIHPSTPEGIQAAIDFGSSLPKARRYTLFHTSIERTRETAEGIARGILDSGGRAKVAGAINYQVGYNPVLSQQWMKRQRWFPEDGAYHYTCLWIAGLRPRSLVQSSEEYSRDMARIVMGNLSGASLDSFHLYVSHDNWVQALIFHWFGVPPQPGGLRYLDGFVMQPLGGGIMACFRGGCELYDYPHWWPG